MKKKKRLVTVAFCVFALFALLIAQYFKIQIIEGEKWTDMALCQHEFIVQIPSKRGSFFSNTSLKKGHPQTPQPLVFDVTKFHLFIDPLSIPEAYKEEIANEIIRTACLESSIEGEFYKKSRSRRIAIWLDREKKQHISSWWKEYAKKRKIPQNALYFIADFKRSYPFGKLLGQVLHTIREMKDDKTNEAFPTGGMESYFNQFLKGKAGKRKLLRSPLNHLEIDKVIVEPENGADIYLTINHCIQAIMEEELEKGVISSSAKGGWAVALDPHSGEIWGMAQYPFYDPSHYRDFFNDPEKMQTAKVKAITDAFELGSIMKPITLAISLQANEELKKLNKKILFDPEEKLDTTRTIFPGRASRPLCDRPRHQALNMCMALQKSSNVYMAEVIDRVVRELGNEWYRKALVDIFGFDQKSGIELPGEAYGHVPSIGRLHPNGALQWSLPTPYSLAIGYNILATSLQMLRAYGVIANGGYLVKPTLIKKIIKEDAVLFENAVNPTKKKVLDESIVKQIVRAMKFSTKPGGTGALAAVNGYTEAGKTGTAEKIVDGVYSKERYISSFIGFSPANLDNFSSTRFVLIVTLDEPKPVYIDGGIKNYVGGRCAAPVFREIARRILEYLGEPLDDPHGYPLTDPRYDPEKADWMPEVKKLKVYYDEWNHK